MKRRTIISAILMAIAMIAWAEKKPTQWVATWATAIQKVEPHNLPPAPHLADNTLRQIVEVSIGGNNVRLQLSNQYNTTDTEIRKIELSEATTQGESPEIKDNTTATILFAGKQEVTMKAGETITSDPIAFRLSPRMKVAITIYFGKCSDTDISGHPGSRTTSYIAQGESNDFTNCIRTDHWYYISNLQVETSSKNGAIAVIGNSITDGRGTTTNHQNRWTDILSQRLLNDKRTAHLSVLNFGLGGNCVIRGGLGPTANSRFDRDALQSEGVKYIIVFEGVNDIGSSWNPNETATQLIESYKQMIQKAHQQGLVIYGATIMPFKGNQYYSPEKEQARQTVNAWIRYSGAYDGVIDFDQIMRDTDHPDRLNPAFLFENDWLHPNADGYKCMGENINLKLFY